MTSYPDWIRGSLLARENELSGSARLALWLELIEALTTGRRLVFGTVIPPEHLPLVRREILPELEARVESVGALRPRRDDSGVLLWPVRTRAVEAQLAKRVSLLAHVNCWYAFSQVATHSIEDILAVGFAPGTDFLLVIAASGLSVFDGTLRTRVAYDPSDRSLDGYPAFADGIGPIARREVTLMGVDGGLPLSRRTDDGWTLGVLRRESDTVVWLSPRYENAERPGSGSRRLARAFPELRAAGFSDTGRTLVLAEARALHLFTRPALRR